MGYLFRIILKYKNGFLTKKIRFFDKNFERLQSRSVNNGNIFYIINKDEIMSAKIKI